MVMGVVSWAPAPSGSQFRVTVLVVPTVKVAVLTVPPAPVMVTSQSLPLPV